PPRTAPLRLPDPAGADLFQARAQPAVDRPLPSRPPARTGERRSPARPRGRRQAGPPMMMMTPSSRPPAGTRAAGPPLAQPPGDGLPAWEPEPLELPIDGPPPPRGAPAGEPDDDHPPGIVVIDLC